MVYLFDLQEVRESTLFAPFLDDGERGHIFFLMLVFETAGLLLSPLTLLLQAAGMGLVTVGHRLFEAFKQRCDAVLTDQAGSQAAVICDVTMQVLLSKISILSQIAYF